MTLHETVETAKKAGMGSIIGIIGIILIVILVRVGIVVKNYLFPPKIAPPTRAYGLLPPLEFPKNVSEGNFTYTLQTTTGQLPIVGPGKTDLPDRLSIFPVIKPKPNFLNLDKVKKKVGALGFTGPDGSTVQEVERQTPYYEWQEQKNFNRNITFDINSYDYKMDSEYLQSLTALSHQYITDEKAAIETAKAFLATAELVPTDLDYSKTETSNNPLHYVTFPQLFSIQATPNGNILVPTTSLSKTHVIQVDFYQKDIDYDLKTGEGEEYKPTKKVTIPIIYPHPPYSTMSFWIASGPTEEDVVQSYYTHKNLDLKDTTATYKLKTPQVAFDELNAGKAYIASYNGNDFNILIKSVFLAYYLGETPQDYAMPVYVFEGNNGFYAYISALTDDQLQK